METNENTTNENTTNEAVTESVTKIETVPDDKNKFVVGKVSIKDNQKLCVRKEPCLGSDVLTRLSNNEQIRVNNFDDETNFYKISTRNKKTVGNVELIEGFCAKEFITIQEGNNDV